MHSILMTIFQANWDQMRTWIFRLHLFSVFSEQTSHGTDNYKC